MGNFTQEDLRQMVDYEPSTGHFFYKTGLRKGKRADKLHKSTGYMRFQFKKERHLAHRLAWFYVYGYFPERLDHKNNDKTDNRLDNLREVSQYENSLNCRKRSNKTLPKGIIYYENLYIARITVEGRLINLGGFSTLEKAESVLRVARENLHKEYANHG